jgi:predicted dehydrogenase
LINELIKKIKGEKINYIEVRVGHNLKYWRKKRIRKDSYFIDSKKGGGAIFELVHEINLINNIFGKIIKIKTITKNILNNYDKCEDQAISIFETNKRISGTLVQDMVSNNKVRYIKIFMDKSLVKLDFIKNRISVIEDKKINIVKNKLQDLQKNLIMKNVESFIEIINRKKFSIKFFDEAVYDLKICKKMHEKF